MIFHQIEIVVVESGEKRALGPRDVNVSLTSTTTEFLASYDRTLAVFCADDLRPGEYCLTVDGPMIKRHTQDIQVHPAPTKFRLAVRLDTQPEEALARAAIAIILDESDVSAADLEQGLQRLEKDLEALPMPELEAAPFRYFAMRAKAEPITARGFDTLLQQVRNDEVVHNALAFLGHGKTAQELTNRLYVKFRPDVSQETVAELLARYQLQDSTVAPGDGVLYRTMAPKDFALQILELSSALESEEAVVQVEAFVPANGYMDNFSTEEFQSASDRRPRDRSNGPRPLNRPLGHTGMMFPSWDRNIIEIPISSLKMGSQPVVAIMDLDPVSEAEMAEHPDFIGANLQPFNGLSNADLKSSGSHGVMCAGLVASPTLGVAPSSMTYTIAAPKNPDDLIEAYRWITGLPAQLDDVPKREAAWIIATSFPPGTVSEAESTFRDIVRLGRNGRGCLLFFSAGNDAMDIAVTRPFGATPFTMSIAASTLDSAGNERIAEYSGWGDVELCLPSGAFRDTKSSFGPRDRVVVPNRPHLGRLPSEPPLFSTSTSAHAGEGRDEIQLQKVDGLLIDGPLFLTTQDGRWQTTAYAGETDLGAGRIELDAPLEFAFPAGSAVYSSRLAIGTLVEKTKSAKRELCLAEPAEVRAGERLWLRTSDGEITEDAPCKVRGEGNSEVIEVEEVPDDYPVGTIVYRDQSHRDLASGTSTATPLCAGIAARMLEAQPQLTWVEVRYLLRKTARKIDRETTDSIAQWLDEDGKSRFDENGKKMSNWKGPYYSRRYGFGRVDAAVAVEEARNYDVFSRRDLMVRNRPGDLGVRSRSVIGESPDIWVRSIDPMTAGEKSLLRPRHEAARRGRDDWIFVRVWNRGIKPSLDAWVRVYVVHERKSYCFPKHFPCNLNNLRGEWPPGVEWPHGSYCLGEVAITNVPPRRPEKKPADNFQVVWIRWPAERKPPKLDPEGKPWEPRLLVEVTPFDGPLTGDTVLECNNLAHRKVEILDPDE